MAFRHNGKYFCCSRTERVHLHNIKSNIWLCGCEADPFFYVFILIAWCVKLPDCDDCQQETQTLFTPQRNILSLWIIQEQCGETHLLPTFIPEHKSLHFFKSVWRVHILYGNIVDPLSCLWSWESGSFIFNVIFLILVQRNVLGKKSM